MQHTPRSPSTSAPPSNIHSPLSFTAEHVKPALRPSHPIRSPRCAQARRHHASNRHAVGEEKQLALPRGTVADDEDVALSAHRILLGGPIGDAADENEQHAELHLESVKQKEGKTR